MRLISKYLLVILFCSLAFATSAAQCPVRPPLGTVVEDPFSLSSQSGVLDTNLLLSHSVDDQGYTHYCYVYQSTKGVIEAPTLRLNPGDTLKLNLKNVIKDGDSANMKMEPGSNVCGDNGPITISTTNVHFHGLEVSPLCHKDDVINTLIEPGSPGFQYDMQIPANQPPGLYWYHPHIHGFTEFQVNGGAAGALIVNGMEKVHPEVAGLTERVFVIRQQYLVPWIPGPYQLTINFHTAVFGLGLPVIQMKPGEKQFWRVVNATIQDFMPLQVQVNLKAAPVELIALDGFPLAQPRMETSILVPPAGRAEFIVTAPPQGASASFITQAYSTGPTGNADLLQTLGNIELTTNANNSEHMPDVGASSTPIDNSKFAAKSSLPPATTQRNLYFSEEFGGTNGPIQFYITVDGQPQKVFQDNEKPVITTKVGAIEDWTIENRALETHAFHMHQIHFRITEIDGKPTPDQDLRDTIEIPYWEGPGHPYHSVKVRMEFNDPDIAGTFLFHCHILLHEDLGMMHKILVERN